MQKYFVFAQKYCLNRYRSAILDLHKSICLHYGVQLMQIFAVMNVVFTYYIFHNFQVYIISSVLLYALPMFIEGYTLNVKLYILPFILPIIHIGLIGSIYSTVALAVERYITICHPFLRYRFVLLLRS